MPKFESREESSSSDPAISEFRKLIETFKIGAISIDATAFDDNGRQYDKGIFSQLRQFGTHPQRLVISEVVLREVDKHFRERVEKSRSRFDRDLLDACVFVGGPPALVAMVQSELDKLPSVDNLCRDRLAEFIRDSDATILKSDDYVSVSGILAMYFQQLPPFHVENRKKSEFPDAIALATLEAWAEKNNTGVIVVSRDGDWEAFCKTSERLYIIKTLADALSIFQTPGEIVQGMLTRLRHQLRKHDSKISAVLYQAIEEYDWSDNVNTAAHSYYEFDEEVEFEIIDAFFDDSIGDSIKITETDGKTVSFALDWNILGLVRLECYFKNWDGSDRGFIIIGREHYSRDFMTSVSILLTMPVAQGDFFDVTIEVQPEPVHVDFDEVSPSDLIGRMYD